jgi:large subunit ribosomal protein L6
MSRIGQKPIPFTDKVKVSAVSGIVTVEGPKGKLEFSLPREITVSLEDGSLVVKRPSDNRHHKALHGTARSILSNMVKGVSDGFVRELEIIGVGFRAKVAGKVIDLSLGKSHPILHPIPDSLTVTVTDNTKIKVEGADKQVVGQFAAEVRGYYPPEPYKGKGIRHVGEFVRRKAGKSVKK